MGQRSPPRIVKGKSRDLVKSNVTLKKCRNDEVNVNRSPNPRIRSWTLEQSYVSEPGVVKFFETVHGTPIALVIV